jgi:Dynamin family
VTATASASPPRPSARTESIVRDIRRTETFRELVPSGAALGWPAVARVHDAVYLTMPIFSQRARPGGSVDLFAPFATITVAWDPVRIARFLDLRSVRAWTADPEAPVGRFPHTGLGDSEDAYLELRHELFGVYDDLCSALAAGDEPSDEIAARLTRRLRLVLEPPLEPHYRWLEPAFFARYLPPARDGAPVAENHREPAVTPAGAADIGTRRVPSHAEVIALLNEADALVDLVEDPAARTALGRMRARLARDFTRVAIVGSMGSGRTTVVNIALGNELLPTVTGAGDLPVVTIVPGDQTRLRIGPRVFARDTLAAGWAELATSDDHASPTTAVLEYDSTWLREAGVELVDTPGLNTERAKDTADAATWADAVVMTVPAPTPLSLDDRAFLDVAARHGLPVLLVVTQLNHIDPGERESVVNFIARRARAIEAVEDVLVPARQAGPPSVDELRTALERVLQPQRRLQQTVAALEFLCDRLQAAASAEVEHARAVAAEGARAVREQRLVREGQEREWERLLATVSETRATFAANTETWFDEQRVASQRHLSRTLSYTPNPKMWWERQLPDDLRDLLAAALREAEASLRRDLERSLRQAGEQVSALTGAPAPLIVPPGRAATARDVELEKLSMHDADKLRLGTLATGAAGYVAFGGLPVVVAGILGALAHRHVTDHQRERIEAELDAVLQDAFARLRDAFTEAAVAAFDKLLTQLGDRRDAWAREHAESPSDPPDGAVAAARRLADGADALRSHLAALGSAEADR